YCPAIAPNRTSLDPAIDFKVVAGRDFAVQDNRRSKSHASDILARQGRPAAAVGPKRPRLRNPFETCPGLRLASRRSRQALLSAKGRTIATMFSLFLSALRQFLDGIMR